MKHQKQVLGVILALVLCAMSVGCSPRGDSEGTDSRLQTTEAETTLSEHPEKEEGVTVLESYLPGSVRKNIESFANTARPYSMTGGPYAISSPEGLGNGTLKRLSVFAAKTLESDEKGDFFFTLYVFRTDGEGIRQKPDRSYRIAVNGKTYGLTPDSNVNRFVDLDVSDYEIRLEANEIPAFLSSDDTLVPGYFSAGMVNYDIADRFPWMYGFFSHMGTDQVTSCTGSLLYDFVWERSYDSEKDLQAVRDERTFYQRTVEALKPQYQGKTVSILGDSISTYAGISNDASANSTVGENAVYYGSSRLPTEENTYWGRLIRDLGMKLCVNNSYSGAKAVSPNADSGVLRSGELKRDDGTVPDLILVYLGTNDLHSSTPVGQLADLLRDGTPANETVENWWKTVAQKTEQGTHAVAGETYNSFDEAYALMLHRMRQAYPDAEIVCINLVPTNHSAFDREKMQQMNVTIDCLAACFGAKVADQNRWSGIDENSCKYDTLDYPNCIHPDASGHLLLSKAVLQALAK